MLRGLYVIKNENNEYEIYLEYVDDDPCNHIVSKKNLLCKTTSVEEVHTFCIDYERNNSLDCGVIYLLPEDDEVVPKPIMDINSLLNKVTVLEKKIKDLEGKIK